MAQRTVLVEPGPNWINQFFFLLSDKIDFSNFA
jgi:hypothetical protein